MRSEGQFRVGRREALGIIAGAVCLGAARGDAWAQAIKTLTIVIPSAPGGGFDQTARSVQQSLQANAIIPAVQVDNIPAGGGIVGINTVLGKRGNPGTILQGGLATIVTSLTSQAKVDINELTPLARLISEYQVIVVPASSDIKTLSDLVAKMKANPASIAWAGGPAGSHDHVSVGIFAAAIGIEPNKINYVPYRGASISMAVLGNQVAAAVSGPSEFEQHVAAGTIRIIGVMAPERVEGLNAATLREGGVDVVFGNWRGLFGAPALPEGDTKNLVAALTEMAKTKTWQDILKTKNWRDAFLPGQEFATFFKEEQKRFASVLKELGVLN